MALKVFMVATEFTPLVKTGGLGDVISGLSSALADAGHEVTVFLPYFRNIKQSGLQSEVLDATVSVPMGGQTVTGALRKIRLPGKVQLIGLENDDLYDRAGIYVDPETGADYADNNLRFGFFAKAALAFCKATQYKHHVLHSHDWQGGMAAAALKLQSDPHFKKTASVFTIHNLSYMGLFPEADLPLFGFSPDHFNENCVRHSNWISLLKAGIALSDCISTVSEKYAEEIRTEQWGFGLEPILNARAEHLVGITNGVNYADWDPEDDPHIVCRYTSENLQDKQNCKLNLLQTFGLADNLIGKPLFGVVSRLIEQKGLDLVAAVAEDILAHEGSLVVLGQGDRAIEGIFRDLSKLHPKRIAVKIDYSEPLAHKIEAGADFFLMPSRFEPCGLNQMYSLRYGTIPIVRAVGGLDDTVKEYWPKTGRGNGFKFADATSEALLMAIAKALDTYQYADRWDQIRKNAMAEDYSWTRQSRRYVKLYNQTRKNLLSD